MAEKDLSQQSDQQPDTTPTDISRPAQYPTATRVENGFAYDISGQKLGPMTDEDINKNDQTVPAGWVGTPVVSKKQKETEDQSIPSDWVGVSVAPKPSETAPPKPAGMPVFIPIPGGAGGGVTVDSQQLKDAFLGDNTLVGGTIKIAKDQYNIVKDIVTGERPWTALSEMQFPKMVRHYATEAEKIAEESPLVKEAKIVSEVAEGKKPISAVVTEPARSFKEAAEQFLVNKASVAERKLEAMDDIAHGNIASGLGKMFDAGLAQIGDHAVEGSAVEKVMQHYDSTFKAKGYNPESGNTDNYVDIMQLPPIDVAQFIDLKTHPVGKAVTEQAQGLLSPLNVAIIAASGGAGMAGSAEKLSVAKRLLDAGWSAEMLGGAYKSMEGFKKAVDDGDASLALYQLTHGLSSGALGIAAGTAATGEALPLVSKVDRDIANGVINFTGKTAEIAATPVARLYSALTHVEGAEDALEQIRKVQKPTTAKAIDYPALLQAAKPQLIQILMDHPRVEDPADMYAMGKAHIQKIENQLRELARSMQDDPKSIVADAETRVDKALDKVFAEHQGAWSQEDMTAARASIKRRLLQPDTTMPPDENGAVPTRQPNLFEVENLRRALGDETQTENAGALAAAKQTAASELREISYDKFKDLGVDDVDPWRHQEAALIDVLENIKRAQNLADKMGEAATLKELVRVNGWDMLATLMAIGGTVAGEPRALVVPAAFKALEIARDYWDRTRKNPATAVKRAASIAAAMRERGEKSGATIPTRKIVPPTAPPEGGGGGPAVPPVPKPVGGGGEVPPEGWEGTPVVQPTHIVTIRGTTAEGTPIEVAVRTNLPKGTKIEGAKPIEQAKSTAEEKASLGVRPTPIMGANTETEEHPASLFGQVPNNETPAKALGHEYAHHEVAAMEGVGGNARILSNQHELTSPNSALTIAFSEPPFVREPAKHTPEEIVKNTRSWIAAIMAGGVKQAVADDLPMWKNKGLTGDFNQAKELWVLAKAQGLPMDSLLTELKRGRDSARNHLTKEGVLDRIAANASVREKGLPLDQHASPGRMAAIKEEILRQEAAREETKNEQGTEQTRGSNNVRAAEGGPEGRTGVPEVRAGTEGGRGGPEEGNQVIDPELYKRAARLARLQYGGMVTAENLQHDLKISPEMANQLLDQLRKDGHARTFGGGQVLSLDKAKHDTALAGMKEKYGESDNPREIASASFVTPEGKFIHLPQSVDHFQAISENGGPQSTEENKFDNRPAFMNDTGAARLHLANERAGKTLAVSVPQQGVGPEQVNAIRQTVGQVVPRTGNLRMERVDVKPETKNELTTEKAFPRATDVVPMLKKIKAITPETEEKLALSYEGMKGLKEVREEEAKAEKEHPVVNSNPPAPTPVLDPTKIQGGEHAIPASTYHEAAPQAGNPWVRRSADPAKSAAPTNTGRQLMVQFSSDLINGAQGEADQATRYYDKLYSGARPGYARLQDFWEIPQWMGFVSHNLPDADVYVVRDMNQAKNFLNNAGYDRVLFSALDVNKNLIKDIAKDYKGHIDVGGYVEPGTFLENPNVKYHPSVESLATDVNGPGSYKNGTDYRHFEGSDVIPRLTMSDGCLHKCAFCVVTKNLTTQPEAVVDQQADSMSKLGAKLVYLNDKTFGQAPNYQHLSDVYDRMKAANPDFKGFIVQTTAAQMNKIPADWLAKSGIKYVELGVESYNDPILKEMHKPANQRLIDSATDKLRQNKIALIPNILIGLPGETAETYNNTLEFLKRNKDVISHANIYNLAVYKDAELGKKLTTANEGDFNENVLEKSFHTNPEVHRQFAGDMYGLGEEMLGGKPASAEEILSLSKEQPKSIGDMDENDLAFTGHTNRVYERAATSNAQNGGFTVHPETGHAPNDGHVIEVMPERRQKLEGKPTASAEDIRNFHEANKDVFAENPELHLGGYKNQLNVSAVGTPKGAEKVGNKLDQESGWDARNQALVPYKGKGEKTEFPGYDLDQRLKELGARDKEGKPTGVGIPAAPEETLPLAKKEPNYAETHPHLPDTVRNDMDEDELAFTANKPTLQKNIFKELTKIEPTVDEVANAAKAGHVLGGWWQRYMDAFKAMGEPNEVAQMEQVGPSHTEALKAFHGALSGNKSVENANKLAWNAYHDWLEEGRPRDREAINDIIARNGFPKNVAAISDTHEGGKVTHEGLDTTKLFKLVNSPQMREVDPEPFTGNAFLDSPVYGTSPGSKKIPSMVATTAGEGNLNRVVFDTHMRDLYAQNGLTDARYIADSIHMRRAARELGLKAGEGQEQVWGAVLGLKELLGKGTTPEEAAAGLDDPTIHQIGKDYAAVILEAIETDPEFRATLDGLHKYGFSPTSEQAMAKLRDIVASGEARIGTGPEVNRELLSKTAERMARHIGIDVDELRRQQEENPTFNFGYNEMRGGLDRLAGKRYNAK